MKKLIILLAVLSGGCQSVGNTWTVVGSAYVESDRPEGKAVAKIEVRFTPPVTAKHVEVADKAKKYTETAVEKYEQAPLPALKTPLSDLPGEKMGRKHQGQSHAPAVLSYESLLERAVVEQMRPSVTP